MNKVALHSNLELLTGLTHPHTRIEAAQLLAQHLDAEFLIIFILDPDLHIHLPAPGFPQTLPGGRAWHRFVSACVDEGDHRGDLPFDHAAKQARGLVAKDGSVLVLLGNETPAGDQITEVVAALPVLSALFRSEYEAHTKAAQARLAQETAAQARQLAETVEMSRRDLQRSLEYTRTITGSLGEGVYATDTYGAVTFLNRMGERLIGWTEAELLGRNMHETIHFQHAGVPWEQCAIFDVLRTGRIMRSQDELFTRKDGAVFPVALTSAPIRTDGDISGAVVVFQDISERKRIEDRLHQTQKLESIGLLAGGIAHDFNNLLTGILGNTSLALEMLSPSHPGRPMLEDAIQASKRAADLTQQILAYSGRGRFTTARVDLSALVREIAALIRASIPRRVALELRLEPDLPATEGDPTQIQQFAMNLIINAAESIGEDNSGLVRVTTGTQVLDEAYIRTLSIPNDVPPGTYIYLQVEDNGSGMNEATIANIFDPFFTTKFTGRGLGLAAVSGIVRGHKGAIDVQSISGKGSTFKVLLPAMAKAAVQAAASNSNENLRGHALILVVDDEETVRHVAKNALQHFGYDVALAQDGQTAIQLLREICERVSLVLLDTTMPGMSTEETLRHLKRKYSSVPVVLSSGHNETDALQRSGVSDVAGFIKKPYSSLQLARKIKEILERSSQVTQERFSASS